ncbi:MAG: tetratricopeptide repeat protein [Planctomycetota bacterium]|nr:tetratricopeptide repeat protein [Planctomycetota bacterium]
MKTAKVQQAIESAVRLHQAGRLGEAEAIYREVLSGDPHHPDALHMLGVMAYQVGRDEVALDLINRAIAAQPLAAEFYSNRGLVHGRQGRLEQAVADYQKALAQRPDYPEAHNNLGNTFYMMGRYSDAATHCQSAVMLRSNFPEACNNLGNALLKMGRTDDAIAAYGAAISQQPNYHEAYTNLGVAYQNKNMWAEAQAALNKALKLNPRDAEALNNLGNVLKHAKKLDAAVEMLRRSIAINPSQAEVHRNLGNALLDQCKYDEAIACYRKAIELRPQSAGAYQSLGNAFYHKGSLDEAIMTFNRAIGLRPDYYEAHNNLGNAYYFKGNPRAAEESCRRSLALRPDFAPAHWNLGLALLLQGMLVEGWKEYNWRWKVEELDAPKRNYPMPVWDGSDLGGRRILLHAEQGFGDVIQFIRYVPMVAARGGRVIVGCQKELVALFKEQFPVERWVIDKEILPAFSVHCALMDLPMVLGTTLETIPTGVPYVQPDAAQAQRWRERLKAMPGCKVGLAWAGRAAHANDRNRSIALATLAPLGQVQGIHFVSLQKGEPGAQAGSAPLGMEIADWTGELEDFSNTAALIANLDVIVTVDTSIAHLAGAMGKPTWLLLPLVPDWRWMMDRMDSPWYPTMKLFRQKMPQDWSDPIARLADCLREFSRGAGTI